MWMDVDNIKEGEGILKASIFSMKQKIKSSIAYGNLEEEGFFFKSRFLYYLLVLYSKILSSEVLIVVFRIPEEPYVGKGDQAAQR